MKLPGTKLFMLFASSLQSKETITVARSLDEGRSAIETARTHPNHAYFLSSCVEGVLSGMFLSGERLATFLGSSSVLSSIDKNLQ